MMVKHTLDKKRNVHFNPDNIDVLANEGANLLEEAIRAGVHIAASCGGAGVCGTCKVLIESGKVASNRTAQISADEYQQGIRQACQSRIITDLSVHVPLESRLGTSVVSSEKNKSATDILANNWKLNPPIRKCYVELPPATLDDNVCDFSRLVRALKQQYHCDNIDIDFDVLKDLPLVLRKKDWRATATCLARIDRDRTRISSPTVIKIEPGDTSHRLYSLALDIGTTTVCGQLLDLTRGQVIAEGIAYNKQIECGSDVITRIAYSQKPGGLRSLQQAVVTTINEINHELSRQSGVSTRNIEHVTAAGNTIMTHILFGLDPKFIRLAPYTPSACFIPPVKAGSLGIKVGRHAYLFAIPAVASYVGGDIVSGVVGTGMHQRKALTLYMDIGTNGEIVIGNSDWMVTASCSAGPAFEGGGIKHGIIATEGAIETFAIDPLSYEPEFGTIGRARPKGICGSGLINIVAGLLEAGVVSRDGQFQTNIATRRIRQGSDGLEYVLAWAPDTQIGRDIVITEIDIDNLTRAKAAMYAGCRTLSESVGVNSLDFEQVIIAGNFGSSLNIEKAITVGLLPDIPRDRFLFVGNGSLLGARLSSFSADRLDDALRVAGMMTNFELSENADFMNNYTAALFLPHTDINEFPTVSNKLARLPRTE
ncbi:MAG: ASKHA domain-containing protein [Dehalococcoidales bacterium]|nr:ASKHA domain-containing protein [Dehalococcoidales bacterium]